MYQPLNSKPFIKWAGGKGKLLSQLDTFLPRRLFQEEFTYIEPFVCGGAMLFHMIGKFTNIRQVVFNDINDGLVKAYRTVRDSPKQLIDGLATMEKEYLALVDEGARKDYYLAVRSLFNRHRSDDIQNTVYLMFLNKTYFNGLYRVNSRGEFNVPIGSYAHPMICNADTILADSAVLNACDVKIVSGDFAKMDSHINPHMLNFFYFDPPYRPLTQTSSFTAYAKGGFGEEDHKRLAAFCKELDANHVLWMQSNADCASKHPGDLFIECLYKGCRIEHVVASRSINCKGDGRGRLTELLIHNDYEPVGNAMVRMMERSACLAKSGQTF